MMSTAAQQAKSSLIISVYKDDTALRLILDSLHRQSSTDFEVIISEDCQSQQIKQCVADYSQSPFTIRHLSQEDDGFRKNIALNRAISASNTEHLIFIDGDCVPHKDFIAAHQAYIGVGIATSGRRLELGERISTKLRSGKTGLRKLSHPFLLVLHMPALLLDHAKNIESGIACGMLHRLTRNRNIRLLGCNFSCHKQDLLKVNGFNEDYRSPGIGEDSDIDWRLVKSGVTIKNVKFSAIQYHLYHPRSYVVSEKNIELFERTKKAGAYTCKHGIHTIDD
jgi:glycosyltransferase involved in cell wall biosynthesis